MVTKFLFPNPLSTDGADKFNYKWMATLLILLAVVSFIVPLHPAYRQQQQQRGDSRESTITGGGDDDDHGLQGVLLLPRVEAACWCPIEFSDAYVKYANMLCANQFNAAIRGVEGAGVYLPMDVPIPVEPHARMGIVGQDDLLGVLGVDFVAKRKQRWNDRANVKADVRALVTYQTPLLLFLLGLCLAMPQAVWATLSDCLAPFNVGRTLRSAEKISSSSDAESRKESIEVLSAALAKNNSRSCGAVLSALYLFKKLLSVLVVLGLIIVLIQHAIPQVKHLDHEISRVMRSQANTTEHPMPNTFLCDFKIRKLQNIQTWTVQCQTSIIDEGELAGGATTSVQDERHLLEFELTVLNIALGLLVVLTVGNVASLVNWLTKLAFGNTWRNPLLIQMAKINTTQAVCHMLQTRGHSGGGWGADSIKLSDLDKD